MSEEFKETLQALGIDPKDLSIYNTAFTHRSFLNESKDEVSSNERLEFLGDSVLSFIVSTFLFNKRLGDEEGALTSLRAYIVKTESLAKVAKHLKLGKYLKLSKGEEFSGGRESTQILANTYEAVLGAIYLDLGIEVASKFVHSTLLTYFEEIVESGPPRDSKSYLQEIAQSKYQVSPKYKIIATSGPDHAKRFKVGVFITGKAWGEGEGSSKQQAEEQAAQQAVEKIAKPELLSQ